MKALNYTLAAAALTLGAYTANQFYGFSDDVRPYSQMIEHPIAEQNKHYQEKIQKLTHLHRVVNDKHDLVPEGTLDHITDQLIATQKQYAAFEEQQKEFLAELKESDTYHQRRLATGVFAASLAIGVPILAGTIYGLTLFDKK